jgi:NADH-ubiquinone oxidoreductase chain 5
MEGPTPVSALIHAATMVTAGVFILIKSAPLYQYNYTFLCFIAFVGALTALFSAIVACYQNDIKKIVAYSTCSQLGFMIAACGLVNYNLAFAHLINHAFYKALLFLSSGFLIHYFLDEQDIRRTGFVAKLYPLIYIFILIGSLSLLGLPFLTGFYSKHLILESSLISFQILGFLISFFLIIASFFSGVYTFKLIFNVFFFKNNSFSKYLIEHKNY